MDFRTFPLLKKTQISGPNTAKYLYKEQECGTGISFIITKNFV